MESRSLLVGLVGVFGGVVGFSVSSEASDIVAEEVVEKSDGTVGLDGVEDSDGVDPSDFCSPGFTPGCRTPGPCFAEAVERWRSAFSIY